VPENRNQLIVNTLSKSDAVPSVSPGDSTPAYRPGSSNPPFWPGSVDDYRFSGRLSLGNGYRSGASGFDFGQPLSEIGEPLPWVFFFIRFSRAGIVVTVKPAGLRPAFTSSQVSGVATVAPGRARGQ
jgi:hypothetical protein